MKSYSSDRFSSLTKYAGISLRGAILASAVMGLSACGGSTVDSVNALASLGNTGPVSNNNGSGGTGNTGGTGSGSNTGSGSGSPVAVSVNLSWTAPSTRLDNTAVTPSAIGGYHVYFGTEQSNLQLLTDINDSAVTTYDTQALSAGTYYFAVAAYDSGGVEGRLSNVAQKVI